MSKGDGKKGDAKGRSKDVGEMARRSAEGRHNKGHHKHSPEQYAPKQVQAMMAAREAVTAAEGLPATKKAFAEGVAGNYFVAGDFLEVFTRVFPNREDPSRTFQKKVIELTGAGENPPWIQFEWIFFKELREETLHKNPKIATGQRRIWEVVTGYIGEEFLEPARKVLAEKRRAERTEEAKKAAEKVAEDVIANASTDMVNLLRKKLFGAYRLPDGTVIERRLVPGHFHGVVVVLKSPKPELEGTKFFLAQHQIDSEAITENNKFSEESRKALFNWQTSVHALLRAEMAKLPAPTAEETPIVVKLETKAVAAPKVAPVIELEKAVKLEDAILGITQASENLYFVPLGKGGVYMQAFDGKMSLHSKAKFTPKAHILSQLLEAQGTKLFIHLQAIRQGVSEKVGDIADFKGAQKELRRFMNEMYMNAKAVSAPAPSAPAQPVETESQLVLTTSAGTQGETVMGAAFAKATVVAASPQEASAS